ncbi:hypothetical protein BUALT_Bualt09G0061800 [Buddleja alternifolia]|uniref:5-methyltetrahydropteroyltriglutamate--homocysteine S-methyltransferase n=1 Tax=Buddleja alternifolia TaxID=168488 RepID=A0AAV6X723_9LAMI|nr:hypothetical protein BUALT_Bualt09G0061800 [Buddleja alternifolia]
MDRLISLEPSNTVIIRIEPGQKCYGQITLRNVMYTMPVAFRLQPMNKTRYTILPHSGIILPLTTITLEIIYHLPPNTTLPNRFPHSNDSFILQSVVAPGAAVKTPSDSVPTEWFTNKKKQVYSDSGIKIMFVGSQILTQLITNGYMDEIREVLEKSDPAWKLADSVNSDGQSLLHLAIAQGRPDLVQLLLEFKPDTETGHVRSGSSPVEAAAASGEALIVELLLAHKASPERSKSSTWGPIHLAAGNGHVDVLRHLLLKRANVNALTKDGNTALHMAVEGRRRDCARLLLANAAITDTRNATYGDTPLHIASSLGDEQMVKLLLHKGANKDIRNKSGKTAYDHAAENGHTKLFDALRLGDNLCVSVRKGELRKTLRLLENGALINGRDQNGWTALHRAAFKGRVDVSRALIEKGVDVNGRDEEGYTALHCAVEAGQSDVIELLVKKGAEIEARTNKGVTALQIAEALQYSGITRLLVHGGGSHVNRKEDMMSFVGREMVVKKKGGRSGGVRRSSFDRSAPHFIVPELGPDVKFSYGSHKAVNEYKEAKALGVDTVPLLVGPVTYLLFSKPAKGVEKTFPLLSLLDKILPIYKCFMDHGLMSPPDLESHQLGAFTKAYAGLESSLSGFNVLIETYFADVPEAAYKTLTSLSGVTGFVVDGRNIWANDLEASLLVTLQSLEGIVGKDKLAVSTPSSLLHTAIDLVNEPKLDKEIKSWLAFAAQKVVEVNALAGEKDEASRKSSPRVNNEAVQKAVAALKGSDHRRATNVSARLDAQQKKLNLPILPTTTIGSFPQTIELRRVRREYKAKKISEEEYIKSIKEEINNVVKLQEELDINVLVHGEPERNDMVEYFGEQLSGFAFTANGWVQSYGSRCVKPPIIYGDVSRPKPMTVFWSTAAQSMTKRPMKGMLTRPVTILNWSLVRNDQPRFETCYQIALAIKDEVEDLEKAGITVIEIDEAALREGLPLRKAEHAFYLDWTVHSFRITNVGYPR